VDWHLEDDENVGWPRSFFQKILKAFFKQIEKKDVMFLATGLATVSQIANPCQIPCCIIKFCYSWAVVQEVWVQGVKADLQKFWIGENLGKISKDLHKIHENLSKSLKIWAKLAFKITWRAFLWRSRFLMDFFGQVCENSGKNHSPSQKFAWSYTIAVELTNVTPQDYVININDMWKY